MAAEADRMLEPEVVSRLGALDFIARTLVEGFLVGLHRSPYHGFSVEFAEYRQYQPGESTQNIDWRVYAKTDRHYVKVFQEETNLQARILLDVSASMDATPEAGRISKLRYGKLLAAALGYLLIKQNDAVALATFDDAPRTMIPPRSSRRQLNHLLTVLHRAEAGEKTDVGRVLDRIAEMVWRRGLIVIISDLIDDPDRVLQGLKHFRHRQHEVLVMHLLDPREIDLEIGREAKFVDPEKTVDPVRTQPWHLRQSYQEAIRGWRGRLARECRQHDIDYVPLSTDTPFEVALLAYLNKRSRLA
ncbi:MAG TPA: DUF58 domain-containing protein [Candidatus Krumholzibacteria bacterium]|nr:DUF58 domain-containing protein [Candidatus Krumholzibacteria bacterium]